LNIKKYQRFSLRSLCPLWLIIFFVAVIPCYSAGDHLNTEEREKIQAYLDSAFQAYVDENYLESGRYFQRVLQIDPNDRSAKKGVKKANKQIENRNKLFAKKLRSLHKMAKRGRWVEAMDGLQSFVSTAPDPVLVSDLHKKFDSMIRKDMAKSGAGSISYMVAEGRLAYLNSKYDKAVELWETVAALVPDEIKYVLMANHAKDKVSEFQSGVIEAKLKAAEAAMEAKNYSEAVDRMKDIVALVPDNEEFQKKLAEAQALSSRFDQRSRIGDYFDRGRSYYDKGQYRKSLKQMEAILVLDPGNDVAQDYVRRIRAKGIKGGKTSIVQAKATKGELQKGIKLYEEEKFQQAAEHLERLYKKAPNPEVKTWLDKVRKKQRDSAAKVYQQGLTAFMQGEGERAVTMWKKTLEIDPNHAAAKRAIAKAKQRK